MKPQNNNQTCNHSWIPIEWIAGKRVYEQNSMYKDWTSNIINAHLLRATKLFCPLCGEQRDVPGDEKDE